MQRDSAMFQRLTEPRKVVTIHVDGQSVRAAAGDTVSAALLLSGTLVFRRTARLGVERGPYCGMGVCFDCLVTIDGAPNRQACLTMVAEGMRIETGAGLPNIGSGLPR